jgi:electron transfer flavoprotein alpha subunit
MTRVLAWSDNPDLFADLASVARRLADGLAGTALGLGVPELVGEGRSTALDVMYRIEPADPRDADAWVDTLCGLVPDEADLLLVGATKLGLEVAPRVAERASGGYAPWATSITVGGDGVVEAVCASLGGAAVTTLTFRPGLVVATMSATAQTAPTVAATVAAHPAIRVLDPGSGPGSGPGRLRRSEPELRRRGSGLEQAQAIVDIGQGVRERADIGIIELLATAIDGQVACSRPLAADRDWFADWVGLSGAKVRPILCIAVGVSGAIQHVVGIRGARTIVAVNNDDAAPILDECDYAVVADLYEFVPVLTARLLERRVRRLSTS